MDLEGATTCSRHNGTSVVDYMALRGVPMHFEVVGEVAEGLSDHAPIMCRLLAPPPPVQNGGAVGGQQYKWVGGDSLDSYSHSWKLWERKGNDADFV